MYHIPAEDYIDSIMNIYSVDYDSTHMYSTMTIMKFNEEILQNVLDLQSIFAEIYGTHESKLNVEKLDSTSIEVQVLDTLSTNAWEFSKLPSSNNTEFINDIVSQIGAISEITNSGVIIEYTYETHSDTRHLLNGLEDRLDSSIYTVSSKECDFIFAEPTFSPIGHGPTMSNYTTSIPIAVPTNSGKDQMLCFAFFFLYVSVWIF